MRVLFFALAILAVASAKRYDGYKVLKVWPSELKHQEYLYKLSEKNVGINLWTSIKDLNHPVDVMVSPTMITTVQDKLNNMEAKFSVMIEDVQKVHEENMQLNDMAKRNKMAPSGKVMDHTFYRNLTDIIAVLMDLELQFKNFNIYKGLSQTYEGRDFNIMRVSGTNSTPIPIWIDCGIHSREWIAPATCLFILDQLSDINDPDTAALLATHEFHIMVNSNPDGYEYTWTDDRLWRKNRVPYEDAIGNRTCYGTDPNRNFDNHWDEGGSSDNPCTDTYHGPTPFSAAESRAVRDAMLNIPNIEMAFHLHAYSEYWMTPYGWTDQQLPANYADQVNVANIGLAALEAVHNTTYTPAGSIADVIYIASGGSTDWMYDIATVSYAYAIELRPSAANPDSYGFILPADQIQPTGEETWAAIKASINSVPHN